MKKKWPISAHFGFAWRIRPRMCSDVLGAAGGWLRACGALDRAVGPGRWTGETARRVRLVRVYLFTYVYVVAVNKGRPNLCTTDVYAIGSKRCGTHNRLGRMCGPDWFRSITLGRISRHSIYPESVHIDCTRISPAYHPLVHRLRWKTRSLALLSRWLVDHARSSTPWRNARSR